MRRGVRLGVDLGGTQVKMALVNERGRVLDRTEVLTTREPWGLVKSLRSAAAPWFSSALLGTGVGVAGDVDPARGVVRVSPNLGWKKVRLAALFRRAGFPGPIRMDNDATAAAWGATHLEFRGRAKNLVILTLGTGVGGGLVFDGRLYHGTTGTAGEVGHLCVEEGGDPCSCGNLGCLEAYLGGASLVRRALLAYKRRGRVVDPLNPKILAGLARKGDPVARKVWDRAANALGAALSNIVNLLNPDTILLTGGVSRGAALFLPKALRIMKQRSFLTPAQAVRVVVSERSSDLGVAGAALLVE
ncbi:MAG: ROK family protein [Elusimicrobia bacterium]|nr:ROK family protein [Elusimicrobiota bacterium]